MTNIKEIRIEEYNYPLLDERIAKHPLTERDKCKLLVRNSEGNISEHIFAEIPDLLPANSMLIYNNTRVINARLRFRKGNGGALIEIFCLEPVEPRDYAVSFGSTAQCSWLCFVGNSKRWKQGSLSLDVKINDAIITLNATRINKNGNASVVMFSWDNSEVTFAQIIEAAGEIPIPPISIALLKKVIVATIKLFILTLTALLRLLLPDYISPIMFSMPFLNEEYLDEN